MTRNNNKTVLFVFSLSASIDAERKPLFGAHKKKVSEQFFKLLHQKTRNLVRESGVDVVWIDETQQQGATFSERYYHAFNSLFNLGYENVISIGNDTPDLTSTHIEKAINLLSKQHLVFGPSKDGGVYLLGYTKASFDEYSFKNFSWLTAKLSGEIENFAIQKNLSYSILETLADIDVENDALAFAYSHLNSEISAFVIQHLKPINFKYNTNRLIFSFNLSHHNFLLRGPPPAL